MTKGQTTKISNTQPANFALGLLRVLLAGILVGLGLFSLRTDWHINWHSNSSHHASGDPCSESDIPAKSASHFCAVDLFNSGGLLAQAEPMWNTTWVHVGELPIKDPRTTLASSEYFFSPGRSPPIRSLTVS
jgi:hypothetical protein